MGLEVSLTLALLMLVLAGIAVRGRDRESMAHCGQPALVESLQRRTHLKFPTSSSSSARLPPLG